MGKVLNAKSIKLDNRQVRATLDGTMTEVRMPIKPQPPEWIDRFGYTAFTPKGHISGRGYWKGVPGDEGPGEKFFKLPYQTGDVIYVRETWMQNAPGGLTKYFYKADEQPQEVVGQMKAFGYKWRTSIHMPKEAARLFLRVTDVKVERVQEITKDGAITEGVNYKDCPLYQTPEQLIGNIKGYGCQATYDYVKGFAKLWDSIYKSRGYGWDLNPWVTVTKFERLEV